MPSRIRRATLADTTEIAALRSALWPDGSADELRSETVRLLSGKTPFEHGSIFVAEAPDGSLIGFVESSLRPYAEGCSTQRVLYLEGWFVASDHRGMGVGRLLVAAAETWGRALGATEMASDAAPENELSAKAHKALGFKDVGLVRCFAKHL